MASVSNAKYYVKSTISSTQAAGTTFLLSTDFELGADLETGTDAVSFVLSNSSQIERFKVTATGGTATIVARGLTQSGTSATPSVGLQKQWGEGTVGYVTTLAFDELDAENAKPQRFTVPTVADNTARSALYPSPTGGEQCRNTSNAGKLETYNSVTAQWEAAGTSTAVGNATTAAAGIVELATGSEVTNGTATGGSGASLAVTPDQLIQEINGSTAKTSAVDADKLALADSAASGNRKAITWANAKAQLANDLPVSTANLGFAKMATDALAVAGTDANTYVNPYQLANYGPSWSRTGWSTDFQTAARYSLAVVGAATNTFGTTGLAQATTGVSGNSCKAQYDALIPFTVGQRVTFNASSVATGSNNECYFGVGALTITSGSHGFTASHIGFKFLKPAGTFNLYATVANGTTETATVLTGTEPTGLPIELSMYYRTASAIDFSYRTSGGSWSSVTTISTNIPASAGSVYQVSCGTPGGTGASLSAGCISCRG